MAAAGGEALEWQRQATASVGAAGQGGAGRDEAAARAGQRADFASMPPSASWMICEGPALLLSNLVCKGRRKGTREGRRGVGGVFSRLRGGAAGRRLHPRTHPFEPRAVHVHKELPAQPIVAFGLQPVPAVGLAVGETGGAARVVAGASA